jgi:putative flippase GtrA
MKITEQTIKFSLVGSANTLIHISIATLLIKCFLASQLFANSFAFMCATTFSYVAHTKYSFNKSLTKKNLSRFLVVTSICFSIAALLARLADLLHLDYKIGIGLVICIIPIVGFLLHRNWTYGCKE